MQPKTCTNPPTNSARGYEPAQKASNASARINWPGQCLEPMRRFVQLRSRGRIQLLPADPNAKSKL